MNGGFCYLYSSVVSLRSLSLSLFIFFYFLLTLVFWYFPQIFHICTHIFAVQNNAGNVELDRHNCTMLVNAFKSNSKRTTKYICIKTLALPAACNKSNPTTKWKPQFIYLHMQQFLATVFGISWTWETISLRNTKTEQSKSKSKFTKSKKSRNRISETPKSNSAFILNHCIKWKMQRSHPTYAYVWMQF